MKIRVRQERLLEETLPRLSRCRYYCRCCLGDFISAPAKIQPIFRGQGYLYLIVLISPSRKARKKSPRRSILRDAIYYYELDSPPGSLYYLRSRSTRPQRTFHPNPDFCGGIFTVTPHITHAEGRIAERVNIVNVELNILSVRTPEETFTEPLPETCPR